MIQSLFRFSCPLVLLGAFLFASFSAASLTAKEPVAIIFDTDLGNDIDDTMALAVAHALQSRGELKILAVTLTKDNKYVAPTVSLVNKFYGRPNIPVGVAQSGVTPEDGKYNRQLVEAKDAAGKPLFPSDINVDTELPGAVALLRKTLAAAEDNSVVIVQIGFFTNLARLLDTPGDALSPLTGMELVKKKVRYVSLMAGGFGHGFEKHKEYNVICDLPAARKMIAAWPTEMVFSGYEIGQLISYPPVSIREDYEYVPAHPVKIGYQHYRGFDKSQSTYDLNSVLYAARPNRGYYTLSEPGTVTFTEEGVTVFKPDPNGKHRYQIVDDKQIAATREALIQLSSEPPHLDAYGNALRMTSLPYRY